MASASDTDVEPANEAPFGVIVGVLTVIFLEPVEVVDAEELVERVVTFEVPLVFVVVEAEVRACG